MTATMNRQAQTPRDALIANLFDLRVTVDEMLTAAQRDELDVARLFYEGSKDGMFWGPVLKIKATMGKLK
jgi:hypothetical protein